jgi:hypothetical protein
MTYVKDPRVDAYLDGLIDWQAWICREVRELVHAADPEHIITAGHDNKTPRTVAIRPAEPINSRALTAMFVEIIANNRAGGWSKLKRSDACP